jgi:hypothetical protein
VWCSTATSRVECPLWVKSRHQCMSARCPPPKADILTQRITDPKTGIAAGYSKQRGRVLRKSSLSSNRVEEEASSEESSPKIVLGACHVLLLA